MKGARAWVERTLSAYRQAVQSPKSHASKSSYRPLFEASIREFDAWVRRASPQTKEELEMQVKEIMTPEVDLIDPEASVQAVAQKMRDDGVGAVPVAENDRLVGMVTDRDIVLRAVAEGDIGGATARQVMSPKILYCFDDQSTDEVLRNMSENQVRRLPVLNRAKRLVGMVSLGDLAAHASADLAGEALRGISRTGL
ncbi:MAG: CBS domain-containing protein [Gammaproteobacteria bacterium]